MKIKPDYGIDSPFIIAAMLILASASFSVGWLGPHLFHISLRWIAVVIGLYFLQGAASMLYYSKVGKLRMREDFLNSVPWRGDEQVLDVGCGRGLLLIAAARRLKTGYATGVDMWLPKAITGNVPNSALENAAIEGVRERVDVKEADARKLPFPDASFDIVISNFVLHEMATSPIAIEWSRKLLVSSSQEAAALFAISFSRTSVWRAFGLRVSRPSGSVWEGSVSG